MSMRKHSDKGRQNTESIQQLYQVFTVYTIRKSVQLSRAGTYTKDWARLLSDVLDFKIQGILMHTLY